MPLEKGPTAHIVRELEQYPVQNSRSPLVARLLTGARLWRCIKTCQGPYPDYSAVHQNNSDTNHPRWLPFYYRLSLGPQEKVGAGRPIKPVRPPGDRTEYIRIKSHGLGQALEHGRPPLDRYPYFGGAWSVRDPQCYHPDCFPEGFVQEFPQLLPRQAEWLIAGKKPDR